MEGKKKIVMIDDEVDLCQLVKENLEETGEYEVATTSNPKQAEDFCRQEKPDLILLDNVMPQRKGSEIAKVLKTSDEFKHIPIIIVSGRGEMVFSKKKDQFQWLPNNPIARERGEIVDGKDPQKLSEAYGVDDYVSKPFATDLLIEVIQEVLKRKEKERKAREEEERGSSPGI